jgi:hypothetical protein
MPEIDVPHLFRKNKPETTGLSPLSPAGKHALQRRVHRGEEGRVVIDAVVVRAGDGAVEDEIGKGAAKRLGAGGKDEPVPARRDERHRDPAAAQIVGGVERVAEQQADGEPGKLRGGHAGESKEVTRISPSTGRCAASDAATPLPMLKPTAIVRRDGKRTRAKSKMGSASSRIADAPGLPSLGL